MKSWVSSPKTTVQTLHEHLDGPLKALSSPKGNGWGWARSTRTQGMNIPRFSSWSGCNTWGAFQPVINTKPPEQSRVHWHMQKPEPDLNCVTAWDGGAPSTQTKPDSALAARLDRLGEITRKPELTISETLQQETRQVKELTEAHFRYGNTTCKATHTWVTHNLKSHTHIQHLCETFNQKTWHRLREGG